MDESLIEPRKDAVTYESYLRVKDLLTLQRTLSSPAEHDETLFIIIHQVYELWFKQILHELALCQVELERGELMRVMHALKRIDAIQKVLIHQVDILETMPPDDFARFRAHLNPASGFQSFQFREVEFRLGLKNPAYLKFYKHDAEATARLEKALAEPTLYDAFFKLLAKRGYNVPQSVLKRDVTKAYESNAEILELFLTFYRNPYQHSDLYVASEHLLDLDEQFILWRYRHLAMVQRMIGDLPGTGGSSGAGYLASTLKKRIFPEIWEVRNHLGSRSYGKGSPT